MEGKENDLLSDPGVRLSGARTINSFQRTRLSAERTMMSVIRTSTSLIGFGFTIYSFFRSLGTEGALGVRISQTTAANFGLALIALGILILCVSLAGDLQFRANMRRQRDALIAAGLMSGHDRFPGSRTALLALIVLLIGVLALLAILTGKGPFR